MGVSSYDITSAAFDAAETADYELSILTGMDSFAYAVRHRVENRLLAYRSYRLSTAEAADWPTALSNLIANDDRLSGLAYGSTVVGWDDARFTLVPLPLYEDGQRTAYLEQLTLVGLDDVIEAEYFHDLNAQLVYLIPEDQHTAIREVLAPDRLHHFAGGLLTVWANRSRRIGHRSISAAIRGNRMLVAAHRNGLLEFFNTFPVSNSQNGLYYLLLAYQQCGWQPDRVPLYLCGEITEHGELYRQFYRYVEDIRFSKYGAPPARPPEMAALPEHLYFELLCLG